jgi:hypothetical protein
VIGRGGMGEVYRAVRVDDQFEQQVAIKVVRPERSTPELAWMTQDLGKDAEALEIQRQAVTIATVAARDADDPAAGPTNPSVLSRYEAIALLQVAMGRRDEAIATLATLVDRGYRKLDRKEFTPLAGNPRFRALAAKVAD